MNLLIEIEAILNLNLPDEKLYEAKNKG